MTTTRLFVVRHGQSTNNRDGLISGYHMDPVLTEQGIIQAEETREKLSHVQFDEAYSSDLQRAAHTAAIIYGQDIHPSKQIKNLREQNLGSIEGLPEEHLKNLRADPHFLSLSDDERWVHKFADDIESHYELATRFVAALKEIAEQNTSKTILVAAHGGALRATLMSIGYAKPSELPSESIDNAAFVELIYNDGTFSVGQLNGVHKTSV